MDEFNQLIRKGEMNQTLVIAEDELDNASNIIYILEVDMDSNAAGGRGGGFGSRKFKKIHGFRVNGNMIEKIVESDDVADIDIGYVMRMPIMIGDEEIMISCSIDPDMIYSLNARFKIQK